MVQLWYNYYWPLFQDLQHIFGILDFKNDRLLPLIILVPHLPEFFLPFRRPKRIRTSFSPSQLIKLEDTFEKNQHTVGAERKELAKTINLSETQVRRQLVTTNVNYIYYFPFWYVSICCHYKFVKNYYYQLTSISKNQNCL